MTFSSGGAAGAGREKLTVGDQLPYILIICLISVGLYVWGLLFAKSGYIGCESWIMSVRGIINAADLHAYLLVYGVAIQCVLLYLLRIML